MKYKYLLVALLIATQLFAVNAYAEEGPMKTTAEINKELENHFNSLAEKRNQPYWVQHNYAVQPMLWGHSNVVRAALDKIEGIKISNNQISGKVEFLLPSDSKVTTPEILKSFKQLPFQAPKTITQTIIPKPKHQYIITLKQTLTGASGDSYQQQFTRDHINTQITCDKVFFKDDTIEIWSDTELDLETLAKDELISLDRTTMVDKKKIITKIPFGGGIKSVKKVEK